MTPCSFPASTCKGKKCSFPRAFPGRSSSCPLLHWESHLSQCRSFADSSFPKLLSHRAGRAAEAGGQDNDVCGVISVPFCKAQRQAPACHLGQQIILQPCNVMPETAFLLQPLYCLLSLPQQGAVGPVDDLWSSCSINPP